MTPKSVRAMANHYITAQGEELPELCVRFEVRLGPIQVGWSRSPQGSEHNECWSPIAFVPEKILSPQLHWISQAFRVVSTSWQSIAYPLL